MSVLFSGGCSCGAVRYECSAPPFVAYNCHCTACQKLTASAFAFILQVPAEALTISRGQPKAYLRVADSGNHLLHYFCGECGVSLFTANQARSKLRVIHGGNLDDPTAFPIQANIWTRSALPWVQLSTEVDNFPMGADWSKYHTVDPSRLSA
jgi:hypothetical protein